MRLPQLSILIVVLSVAAMMPPPAGADPIVLQDGGVVHFDTGDPPFFGFVGDGVQLFGLGNITTAGAFTCRINCAPGTLVDLGAVSGGPPDDFVASAFGTVHGTAYGPGEDPDPLFQLVLLGRLVFDGPAVSVPDVGDQVELTGPFTFSGSITGFRGDGLDPRPVEPVGDPLFQLDLTGQGRARMRLARAFNPDDGYEFRSMTYEFSTPAAVPEPGTLLLLGGGLAGLWVRRRRR